MQQLYVTRDPDGQISGLTASPAADAEPAAVDDTEVQAFLRQLDVDLVRVLEDVIDLLIAHGVFRFTDLPDSAREKLLFRKNLRSQWQAVPDPLAREDALF